MEKLFKYVKNISYLSTLIGAYYLLVYCIYEGISFPLELSVLLSLLLALGLISGLVTLVIIAYSTLFVTVVTDPLKINYTRRFYTQPHPAIPKRASALINFLIYFCLTPIILLLLIYTKVDYLAHSFYLSILIIPLLYSWYTLSPNEFIFKEKFKVIRTLQFVKISLTYFFINVIAMISTIIFMQYVSIVFELKSVLQVSITFIVFFMCSFILLTPPNKGFKLKIRNNEIVEKSLLDKALSIPATYVYVAAIFFAFWPPMVRATTEVALRFLNIGAIERSYHHHANSDVSIPPEIYERCEGSFCTTKKLNVRLDLGELLYVRADLFGESGTVISLPRKELYIIKHGKIKKATSENDHPK